MLNNLPVTGHRGDRRRREKETLRAREREEEEEVCIQTKERKSFSTHCDIYILTHVPDK